MDSDFSAMGKAARALIPVPKLPIDSIRARARSATTRDRLRALIVCGAIGIAILGTGAAVGEKVYDGVRVWLSGGNAALTVRSLVMVREPTLSDLRKVVSRATFPIVFPVGVPAGTRVTMILFAPAERPNFVEVQYRNERANFNVGFFLVDSATVNNNHATLPTGPWLRLPFHAGYQWRVGRETVLVPKFARISSRALNQIEAAMVKASPAGSLPLIGTMLRKVTLLGARPALADIAEHYAPLSGRSVLLDPQLTRRIPSLAEQGKPVVDDRTIYLSNIPSVHGEPDYSKATLRWPTVIVVSAAGVRAIEAVLRFTSNPGDCDCVILFNQRRTTYWVWKIPLSAASRVQKFSVDAKNFVVTPST